MGENLEQKVARLEHSNKVFTDHITHLNGFLKAQATVWDMYARAALTGLLASEDRAYVAVNAAEYADAMMAERAKRFSNG